MTCPFQGVDHLFLGTERSRLRGDGPRRGVGHPLFGRDGLLLGWPIHSAEWVVHSQASTSRSRTYSAIPKRAPPAPKRERSIPQSEPSVEWNRDSAGRRGTSASWSGSAIPRAESSIPSPESCISRTPWANPRSGSLPLGRVPSPPVRAASFPPGLGVFTESIGCLPDCGAARWPLNFKRVRPVGPRRAGELCAAARQEQRHGRLHSLIRR